MLLSKAKILSELESLKPFLAREFLVKEIGLFGSYVTDQYTEQSDIDLLVELQQPIGWKILTLELFLENHFGKKIDLVTKNALRKQTEERILNEVSFA